jgi:hypothetical protein
MAPSWEGALWSNCCTRLTRAIDPQGIWWLDDQRQTRHDSELSASYAALASGEITWHELPYYRFGAPLDRDLTGYLRLMSHWKDWIDLAWQEAA